MSAASVDLEDCNNLFKGFVGSMFGDYDVNTLLNPPFRKLQPQSYISSSSIYEMPNDAFDIGSDFTEMMAEEYLDPFVSYIDCQTLYNESDIPTFGSPSLSDMENDFLLSKLVSPDSVLPNPFKKEDNEGLDLTWSDLGLSDQKLMKMANDDYLDEEYISLDDLLVKNSRRPRKLTHLDIDHCYSQRPPTEYDDDEEEEEEDYFNSSPYSPESSSCSDYTVAARGTKRARPRKRIVRRKKIKKEVIESSEDEEVDVETPCAIPLVPKITIAITPPPTPPVPSKRGRKPKNVKGQIVQKTNNKNCPVSPKVLKAAIKLQKKSYITKSGRVTKISNSVETTPSTSMPSSVNNSRSNSDNEDNVDKRASHNEAERNRRQELTNLFQQLRQRVPDTKKNTKASKVSILQTSTDHIVDLKKFAREKKSLKKQLQAQLEERLALLESLKSS